MYRILETLRTYTNEKNNENTYEYRHLQLHFTETVFVLLETCQSRSVNLSQFMFNCS